MYLLYLSTSKPGCGANPAKARTVTLVRSRFFQWLFLSSKYRVCSCILAWYVHLGLDGMVGFFHPTIPSTAYSETAVYLITTVRFNSVLYCLFTLTINIYNKNSTIVLITFVVLKYI